jgi:hypothetical protein
MGSMLVIEWEVHKLKHFRVRSKGNTEMIILYQIVISCESFNHIVVLL